MVYVNSYVYYLKSTCIGKSRDKNTIWIGTRNYKNYLKDQIGIFKYDLNLLDHFVNADYQVTGLSASEWTSVSLTTVGGGVTSYNAESGF